MTKPANLVQGTLDLLILKVLELAPLNGWAIGRRLKQVSNNVLVASDGSLYPALHKLEQPPAGRRYLAQESANWSRLSEAVTQVLRLTEADHAP